MLEHRTHQTSGATSIPRLADALFLEMIPDHHLAPLFKGISNDSVVAGLQMMLSVLVSEEALPDDARILGLCPAITLRRLTASQRMSIARILIDCMLDAGMHPEVALTALDRLYAILHDASRQTTTLTPGRWERPLLQAV